MSTPTITCNAATNTVLDNLYAQRDQYMRDLERVEIAIEVLAGEPARPYGVAPVDPEPTYVPDFDDITPAPVQEPTDEEIAARYHARKPVLPAQVLDTEAVRTWGRANGYRLAGVGRLPKAVIEAYELAHA